MLENVRKMRAAVLTGASFALTGAVIANAYFQKHQFYPSVVYITKSNPSMAVLYIQAFVFVILLGKLMRKVFFGQLRAAETEHLIERSWYAVTETCLAFTVFRDDFSPRFVAQFTMLLYLKCFHWLIEDRVDYMERSPIISWLFHIRVVSMLFFLGVLDALFVHIAYYTTVQSGASVQLVFGFEYAILLTIVVTVIMKYILHTIDLQSENPWDNKAVHLLYTELVTGFIKGSLYVAFMVIMIKIHTFPLFAIRPMYLTLRAFKKSLNDVIMSRRAIANMNTLYPDATPEELAEGDNVCIICREEMTTGCKKLPCNHIFHTSCLRSWFQRQQTCPTCRMDVLRPQPPPTPAAAQPQPQIPQQVPPPGGMPFGFQGFNMWNPMFHPHPGQPPVGQAPPQGPGGSPAQSPPQTPGFGVPPVPPTTPTTPAPGSSNMAQEAQAMPSTGTVFPDMSQMASMFPPMMMPPLPFMVPPPMFGPAPFAAAGAGGSLSSMNVEQLVTVENQERQQVEARIQMLRSIHALLDTAIQQMNQYSQMILQQENQQSTTTPNGATTSSVPTEPGISTVTAQPGTSSATAQPGTSSATAQPGTSTATPQPGTSTATPQPGTSTATPQPETSTTTPQLESTSSMQHGQSGSSAQPSASDSATEPGTSASTAEATLDNGEPSVSSPSSAPSPESETPGLSSATTETPDKRNEESNSCTESSPSTPDQVRQRRLQHFQPDNQ